MMRNLLDLPSNVAATRQDVRELIGALEDIRLQNVAILDRVSDLETSLAYLRSHVGLPAGIVDSDRERMMLNLFDPLFG